jgi:hypothetical protein
MIRRIVLFSVAALGLTLVPLSATGYDAPPYTTTVSDSTPTVGQPFTVATIGIGCGTHSYLFTRCRYATLTITSDPASISDDAITIAGTKSLTGAARFDDAVLTPYGGTVVWTVTLAEAGRYTLTVVRDETGEVMGTTTVVVGASDDGGRLSDTGFDARLALGGAGALVIVGVVVVWLARRRARGRAEVS